MRLIYVAGPFRSNTEAGVKENVAVARNFSMALWAKGYAVLCPHTMTADMIGATTEEGFLEGTLEMLKRCDAIFLLPNWQNSVGAKAEYDYAIENDIEEVTLDE